VYETPSNNPSKTNRRPAPDPLLSMRETASWLGVHLATVRRLVEAGKIRTIRLSARRIGIRTSEIEHYLAAAEQSARPHRVGQALARLSAHRAGRHYSGEPLARSARASCTCRRLTFISLAALTWEMVSFGIAQICAVPALC